VAILPVNSYSCSALDSLAGQLPFSGRSRGSTISTQSPGRALLDLCPTEQVKQQHRISGYSEGYLDIYMIGRWQLVSGKWRLATCDWRLATSPRQRVYNICKNTIDLCRACGVCRLDLLNVEREKIRRWINFAYLMGHYIYV